MTQASPSSPSLLRRPGCWLTFAAAIPLLIGIAWVVEDWAGRRHLEKTKARLAAEGFEFDADKLLPHPVPDEENFCAIPLLRAIGNKEESDPGVQRVLKIAEWLSPRHLPSIRGRTLLPLREHLFTPELTKPQPTDWAAAYADLMALDPATFGDTVPADPAQVLSDLLEREAGREFAELEQALDRPHALWLPLLRDQDVFDELEIIFAMSIRGRYDTRWGNMASRLAQVLFLRFHLALATGETARQTQTWSLLWRLGEASSRHGLKRSINLADLCRRQSLMGLWAAAQQDSSPELWRRALEVMGSDSFQNDAKTAIMVEVGSIERALAFHREELNLHIAYTASPSIGFYLSKNYLFPTLEKGLPIGASHFRASTTLSRSWEVIAGYADTSRPDRFFFQDDIMEWVGINTNSGFLFDRVTGALAYNIAHMAQWTVCSELMVKIAVMVAAVELHHHEHGVYPASWAELQSLAPKAFPQDLDGQPLRYALTPENSRYKIWSLGINGVDDGGRTFVIHTRARRNANDLWAVEQPDLVWKYP